jgi:hypothetical protein
MNINRRRSQNNQRCPGTRLLITSRCPASDTPLAGAAGNGFMGYDRLTSMSMIKDGTSNTIALMEIRFGRGPWARGGSSTLRAFDPADLPLQGEIDLDLWRRPTTPRP